MKNKNKYKIVLLPGDGIGRDVVMEAEKILQALSLPAEYLHADIGWEFWVKEGNPLPARTIEVLKKSTCVLMGAITSKPKVEAQKELDRKLKGREYQYFSPIVKLRQLFNLKVNLRPCKAYPGNPLNYQDNIDLVIFRENTEGMYSGVEFLPLTKSLFKALNADGKMERFKKFGFKNIAISTRVITKQGAEAIIRAAFEYARKKKRKSVTLAEKPNVLRQTSGLMLKVFREVARQYPEIEIFETNIDAQCMWLIKKPKDFDVIVSSNLFGDILSDIAAQLVGGLGFAPSANIGDNFALFEPTHGSAPKYAGKDIVNPIAMFLSIVLMLDWLGESEKSELLETAIAAVIKEGKVRTKDMGGKAKTTDVTKAVIDKL